MKHGWFIKKDGKFFNGKKKDCWSEKKEDAVLWVNYNLAKNQRRLLKNNARIVDGSK